MEKIIYALKCPVTGNTHYIGKSTQGMRRPLSHLRESHSKKINEWVGDLKFMGHKPDVEILYEAKENEDLDTLEALYISKYINKGEILFNEILITPMMIRKDYKERTVEEGVDKFKEIGKFVAIKRKEVNLSQEEFADRIGIALTVLRKIEQGKTNFTVKGLLNVLVVFGCTLQACKI